MNKLYFVFLILITFDLGAMEADGPRLLVPELERLSLIPSPSAEVLSICHPEKNEDYAKELVKRPDFNEIYYNKYKGKYNYFTIVCLGLVSSEIRYNLLKSMASPFPIVCKKIKENKLNSLSVRFVMPDVIENKEIEGLDFLRFDLIFKHLYAEALGEKIETLYIYYQPNLTKIPDSIVLFPNLKKILLQNTPNIVDWPACIRDKQARGELVIEELSSRRTSLSH